MFYILLLGILYHNNTLNNNSQSNDALKKATTATLKQTDIESDFFKAKKETSNKVRNYLKANNLDNAAIVASNVFIVSIYRKIRVKSNNFIITVSNNKTELTWNISF